MGRESNEDNDMKCINSSNVFEYNYAENLIIYLQLHKKPRSLFSPTEVEILMLE